MFFNWGENASDTWDGLSVAGSTSTPLEKASAETEHKSPVSAGSHGNTHTVPGTLSQPSWQLYATGIDLSILQMENLCIRELE